MLYLNTDKVIQYIPYVRFPVNNVGAPMVQWRELEGEDIPHSFKEARYLLQEKFSNICIPGHDMDHFLSVAVHAYRAIKCHPETLSVYQKELILIASLLHDADDSKIFPNNKDNENSKVILSILYPNEGQSRDTIIKLINLVSCSKNHTDPTNLPSWYYIPRDSDRLEAMGIVGAYRCHEYSVARGDPVSTEDTWVATCELMLDHAMRLDDRFNNYTAGKKKSPSIIDHYYDKLLHIGKKKHLKSRNPYILIEANIRTLWMREYIKGCWKDIILPSLYPSIFKDDKVDLKDPFPWLKSPTADKGSK